MKTVYKSGISWGLVTFIALVILLCYLFILFLLPWIGVILLLITTVFIVDVFVNTRYTIEGKTLRVQCGIFYKTQFDIERITTISKSTSLESSPAASMNRIQLRFSKRQTLIISPRQQQAFIDHLLSINPHIVVKPPLSATNTTK